MDLPTLARPTCHGVKSHCDVKDVCEEKEEKFSGEARIYSWEENFGGRKKMAKKGGDVLTYDTTLQVVTRSTQQDLFLHGGLLGGHLLFLLAAIKATRKSNIGGGGGREESSRREKRGTSRTSCRSEKDQGGGSRDVGCPRY